MHSRLKIRLVATLLTLSAPAVALELPKPFVATYAGTPYVFGKLEATITLERMGDHLKYTMQTIGTAPFYRNELYDCSVLTLRGGRLYVLEYKHTDKKNAENNVSARFDWNARTVTVTRAGQDAKRITELQWPVWDPLSLQIGIMTDLLNKEFTTEKVYRLLERGEVKDRRLRRAGGANIEHAGAPLKVVRVERADRDTEQLWFAADYRHIPVRIQLKNIRADLNSDPAKSARDASTESGAPRC